MRIAITGSRSGVGPARIEEALSEYVGEGHDWLLGGAVGVDTDALRYLARCEERITVIVPQTLDNQPEKAREVIQSAVAGGAVLVEPGYGVELYGKACLARNRMMVDRAEMVIAFPRGPEVLRSGTWATVRYARKENKQVVVR